MPCESGFHCAEPSRAGQRKRDESSRVELGLTRAALHNGATGEQRRFDERAADRVPLLEQPVAPPDWPANATWAAAYLGGSASAVVAQQRHCPLRRRLSVVVRPGLYLQRQQRAKRPTGFPSGQFDAGSLGLCSWPSGLVGQHVQWNGAFAAAPAPAIGRSSVRAAGESGRQPGGRLIRVARQRNS